MGECYEFGVLGEFVPGFILKFFALVCFYFGWFAHCQKGDISVNFFAIQPYILFAIYICISSLNPPLFPKPISFFLVILLT